MSLEPHAAAVFALTIAAFLFFSRDCVSLETTSVVVLALLVGGFHLFPFERDDVVVAPADFFWDTVTKR